MKKNYFKNFKYVIITGASSGIGKSFIENLYALNQNIKFFNLSRNPLTLKSCNFQINGFCDLTDENQLQIAISKIKKIVSNDVGKILLINCAGVGDYNEFKNIDKLKLNKIINLNISSHLTLTLALTDEIIKSQGDIINVCSTAAFQPTPFLATYGASKSFMLMWSLAIREEFKPYGCKVLALCPGPTPTNFFDNSQIDVNLLPDKLGSGPKIVTSVALNALVSNKAFKIVGRMNYFLILCSSFVPMFLKSKLAYKIMKKFQK